MRDFMNYLINTEEFWGSTEINIAQRVKVGKSINLISLCILIVGSILNQLCLCFQNKYQNLLRNKTWTIKTSSE